MNKNEVFLFVFLKIEKSRWGKEKKWGKVKI